MTKEQIHNIYLHMTGKAEGLLEAGAEADFPIMFAEAIIQYNKPRELTEDEIREVADSVCHTWKKNGVGELYMTDFARAILKKASEKYCNKCNNTGWVCEWHPDKEAHKCCGGAGMPCECTKESE